MADAEEGAPPLAEAAELVDAEAAAAADGGGDAAEAAAVAAPMDFAKEAVPVAIPANFFKQVEIDLEDARVGLAGVTTHDVPHVSDEVILQALREHNVVLTLTRGDVDRHDDELEAAREESRQLRARLEAAEARIEAQADDLAATKARVAAAEENVSALQDKVSGLDDLEETVKSQGLRLTALHETQQAMGTRFDKRFEAAEGALARVEGRVGSVEGAASRLEGRVDKLKEELLVPAHNVTLPADLQAEGEAGGSEDDVAKLTHLLGVFRDSLEAHEAAVERQRKMLEEHAEAIDGKASIDVEDAVRAHAAHLEGVQSRMDARARAGFSGVPRGASGRASSVDVDAADGRTHQFSPVARSTRDTTRRPFVEVGVSPRRTRTATCPPCSRTSRPRSRSFWRSWSSSSARCPTTTSTSRSRGATRRF